MKQYLTQAGGFALCALLIGCGGSKSSKVEPVVNAAPIAKITVNKSEIAENESLSLSALNSSDPDGDTLSYLWSVTNASGQSVHIDHHDKAQTTFSAAQFGQYTIALKVKDALLTSDAVTHEVTVTPSLDDYPVAKMVENNTAKIGATHWLNGEQSTGAHGQLIAYQWQLISKPENSIANIADETQVNAYFVADVAGDYVVEVTVTHLNDGLSATTQQTITVDSLQTNTAPIAVLTADSEQYRLSQTVKLDGSKSYDLDNDILNYQWQWENRPQSSEAELTVSNSFFAQFTPDVLGEYRVKLILDDGYQTSKKVISVNVTNNNIAPVANAGKDVVAIMNNPVVLDGSQSYDMDNQTLKYEWRLISRPQGSDYLLHSGGVLQNSATLTVSPDVSGLYTYGLRVHDGITYSELDTMTVTVSDNQRPVAVLPEDMVVRHEQMVQINGSDSYDPEGQPLTYDWQLVSAPDGFTGQLTSVDDFTQLTPTLLGSYTVQLVVNDQEYDSVPQSIVIVKEEAVTYVREVTGRFVDSGNNPIPNIQVKGLFQPEEHSDENGQFSMTLSSYDINARLRVLFFVYQEGILGYLRLAEYSEEPLDLGDVVMPVMQRKDIIVTACDGYTGSENVEISFFQHSDGYENIRFMKAQQIEFSLNSEPQSVMLPANAELELRVIGTQLYIEASDGRNFMTHQYQEDDSQQDIATLTVCHQ